MRVSSPSLLRSGGEYSSFAELERHETAGIDYRISTAGGCSGVAVMAPHGGISNPGPPKSPGRLLFLVTRSTVSKGSRQRETGPCTSRARNLTNRWPLRWLCGRKPWFVFMGAGKAPNVWFSAAWIWGSRRCFQLDWQPVDSLYGVAKGWRGGARPTYVTGASAEWAFRLNFPAG